MKILPESRFVSLSAREPDTHAARTLAEAARRVTSWHTVGQLGVRHRVAEYVLRSSSQAGVQLPVEVLARLGAESLMSQAQVMLLNAELERAIGALAAASIPVLVLKGPALARTLYRDPALRPYGDLDLTVHAHHVARAAEVLAGMGYAELQYDAAAAQHAHVGHLHESGTFHRMFAGAGGRALIELHQDPLQLGVEPACEAGRWQRAVGIPDLPGGLMLGLEDQVIQLSVHAHKHGFSRLIWFKDLDLLLRQHAARLDWKLIEAVARREGVAASVWYTLRLGHTLLGTPFPVAAARLAPRAVLQMLYGVIWPAARVANLEGFLRRRAVQFHAAESWHGMLPSLILMGRRSVRISLLRGALLSTFRRGHPA